MKKVMIAALLLLGASSAFAGDSDALKAVKKAKTYAEAEALVKQNLNSLANAKEKAAAYNYLVDLAVDYYNAQNNTMAANELAMKTGQKTSAVDTLGMYDASYNAVVNAIECAKYDNMPDEKGKVKPKFQAANLQRITQVRLGLVNEILGYVPRHREHSIRQQGHGEGIPWSGGALCSLLCKPGEKE